MAILRSVAMLLAVVVLLLSPQAVISMYEGVLECEELTALECAFAVSSAGARCVLEKSTLPSGKVFPSCQTSLVIAERPGEWIESDECIQACGLERQTYGLSTDSLVESGFRDKLCSSKCQNNCPNIVDIYHKLAAGEGVYLPRLCNEQKFPARRLIDEPVLAAQTGPSGAQRGVGLSGLSAHLSSQWETSRASVGTPSPKPSPAYGVRPSPTSLSPVPSPAPGPSPPPVPPPIALSLQPIEDVSSSGAFGNDFEGPAEH